MLDVTGEPGTNRQAELSDDGEAFGRAAAQLVCRVRMTPEVEAALNVQGPLPTIERDKRRFVRFACHAYGILDVKPTLPSIPRHEQRFLVLIKNVSRSGICLLHEAQLFPRERCQLWMEARRPLTVEVARCRRLHEGCYEIGTRFV